MKFKSLILGMLVMIMALHFFTACSSNKASNSQHVHDTEEEESDKETTIETSETRQECDIVFDLFSLDQAIDHPLYDNNNIFVRLYGISFDVSESYGVETRYIVSYLVRNNNDYPIGFYVDSLIIDNFEFEIERYIYVDANSETWVDVPLLTYALRNYTEYSPVNVYEMQLHSYFVNENTGEMIVDPTWISFETTNAEEIHLENEGINFDNGIILYDEDGVVIHCVDIYANSGGTYITYCYFIIENNTESVVNVRALGALVNGDESLDATFDVDCEPGIDTITCFELTDTVVNDIVVHFEMRYDSDSTVTFDSDVLEPSMFNNH